MAANLRSIDGSGQIAMDERIVEDATLGSRRSRTPRSVAFETDGTSRLQISLFE